MQRTVIALLLALAATGAGFAIQPTTVADPAPIPGSPGGSASTSTRYMTDRAD